MSYSGLCSVILKPKIMGFLYIALRNTHLPLPLSLPPSVFPPPSPTYLLSLSLPASPRRGSSSDEDTSSDDDSSSSSSDDDDDIPIPKLASVPTTATNPVAFENPYAVDLMGVSIICSW